MGSRGNFTIAQSGDSAETLQLTIEGELDVITSPQLKQAMTAAFSKGPRLLRVALDRVPKMDSSGVATLVEGLRWSRRSGGRFILSGLQEPVLDLIRISKLDSEFEIMADDSATGGRQ